MKLDTHVNLALVPVKAVYFFFLSGMSCLLPFVPIYLHQLGLTVAETGLIKGLEPCVSLIFTPLGGGLADKYNKHKFLLIISIIVGCGLFFLLMFLPPTNEAHYPDNDRDPVYEGISLNQNLILAINCSWTEWSQSILCSDDNLADLDICDRFCNSTQLTGGVDMRDTTCLLCLPEEAETSRTLLEHLLSTNYSASTVSPLQPAISPLSLNARCLPSSFSNFTLTSCLERFPNRSSCTAVANWAEFQQECPHPRNCTCGDSANAPPTTGFSNMYVLMLTFAIILPGKAFICNVAPLLDITIVYSLRDRPQDYGKQRLWGSIGWGVFALVSGALIDVFTTDEAWVNYDPAFYLYLSLISISVISCRFLSCPSPKSDKKILKHLFNIVTQANVATFLVVVFVAGFSFGIAITYTFFFLEEIHSSRLLMGLTLSVNCFAEVVFLFYSGRIIKKITYVGVAYLTLVCYAIRFLGYSLITKPWWVLPLEPLHGFTYGVFWAACTSFANANAPTGMKTTLLAVLSTVHFGIGNIVGCVLGGFIYQKWGSQTLFRSCLFLCLGTAVVYFLLRRFLVGGATGPLAVYRKFSLVKGELSSPGNSTAEAMDNQRMQLTLTSIDQATPTAPPVTQTFHRPLLHTQIPNIPDSPDSDLSPGTSSLSKLLRIEDRLPAAGQEVIEMAEGSVRLPALGQESDGPCKGKQTAV